jgi:hypothetical protein
MDSPTSTVKCDGFARSSQQGNDPFTFDTLRGQELSIQLQPKAIHDEMNPSTFDEYGRTQANLGVESVPATPGLTNVNLMPYPFPMTEIVDVSKAARADLELRQPGRERDRVRRLPDRDDAVGLAAADRAVARRWCPPPAPAPSDAGGVRVELAQDLIEQTLDAVEAVLGLARRVTHVTSTRPWRGSAPSGGRTKARGCRTVQPWSAQRRS